MALHKNSSGRGIHQPGQYQVTNTSGADIPKGTAVRVTGLDAFITVAPVNNPTTNNILGVVVDDVLDGEQGYVARMGLFGQLDTTAFTVGDILYSDGVGTLTTVSSGPQIGIVMSVNVSDGNILFDVHDPASGGGSGGHNVLITTLTQTDIDNGFINLPATPATPTATIVLLDGAPAQTYGDDYSVSGNTLSFISTDSSDLGNILTAGDKITTMYK